MAEYKTGQTAPGSITRYQKNPAPVLRVASSAGVHELCCVRDDDGARHWALPGGGAAGYVGVMQWCRNRGYSLLTPWDWAMRR